MPFGIFIQHKSHPANSRQNLIWLEKMKRFCRYSGLEGGGRTRLKHCDLPSIELAELTSFSQKEI
jgi:hypothetical protein